MTDTNQTASTPEVANNWAAALSPELKSLVDAKGYKTPADVVQAYAHAQRLIGADKIALPKNGEWDEHARSKLGIPSNPDGYTLNRPALPEGVPYDEAFEAAAKPVAHKLGLTPQQFQGLLDFYAGHQQSAFEAAWRAHGENQTQAEQTLKSDWGADYDAKISQAARAARYFGGEDLVAFLNDTGTGNSPHLIRAFAKAGALLSEDRLQPGGGEGGALPPAEALRKARELMARAGYASSSHTDHASLVDQVRQLFEQAYAPG